MINYYESVKHNPLFKGIPKSGFNSMLSCLCANSKSYDKNEIVLMAGEEINFVGIILNGSVKITRSDADGSESLIAQLSPPELFGEAFACAEISISPVTVTAREECEILFLNYKKIITSCSSACVFHAKLIENMLNVIAHKNIMLNRKIEIISKRTTREKLMCFFNLSRGASASFTLKLSREELARYLCVDRSAMSAELSRMQRDGLINVNKSNITVLDI